MKRASWTMGLMLAALLPAIAALPQPTAGAANPTSTVMLPGNVPLELVWIPGAAFTMGSPDTEVGRDTSEGPQHSVTLGGYWIGRYEVTKGQWQAVMGTTPWDGYVAVIPDPESPALYVSWNDAQSFVAAINSYTGTTFRLPSEAEWEYACRGGQSTRFYWGDDSAETAIGGYAWYVENTWNAGEKYAHLTGVKTANAFGLFDMSGNAIEWCQDWWHDSYTGAPTDGSAWETPAGTDRVTRGGGWKDSPSACRSSSRKYAAPDFTSRYNGFRIAAPASASTPPTGSIVINNNRSATNSRTVTIAMTWSAGVGSDVARMRFSDDGSTWSAYESLAASKSYTLPVGADGHRTVRVQFIDKLNHRSATYSDYILLDRTAPTGTITINGGASTTTNAAVTLGLTWADAGAKVSRMRFSDNGSTWTAWTPPTATCAHTLPPAPGYHTVRVQYLDGAGNYSAVYNDYIKLLDDSVTKTVMLPASVPLVLKWIPAGTFLMGRYPGEQNSYASEDPQHSVTLAGFWMAEYEVTKRQWEAVMKSEPWSGQSYVLADLDSPAVYVSWNDAQSFITAVNAYVGMTLRLPSESEWEYTCRAGSVTPWYWGDDPYFNAIGNFEWWSGNTTSGAYAHVVGQKLPNNFGLYDMSGNASEFCEDDNHNSYTGAPTGGQAWTDSPRGAERVVRGGAWNATGVNCRSAFRTRSGPGNTFSFIGFRLACTP